MLGLQALKSMQLGWIWLEVRILSIAAEFLLTSPLVQEIFITKEEAIASSVADSFIDPLTGLYEVE
jgi:hypothetical protein